MFGLIGTALAASFVDSLNPSAIAQQMLLQSMVKKKRHTLYFILGMGLANVVLGLGIYYGVVDWVSGLISQMASAYPIYTYGTEIIVGTVCLIFGVRLTVKTARGKTASANSRTEAQPPAGLSPLSLFIMGAAFCGVELTSALPYFGFLATLASYDLVFPLVLAFIALYSFIYALPLILIYLGYSRLQGTKAIIKLENALGRISAYVVPVALGLFGIYMIWSGIHSLI